MTKATTTTTMTTAADVDEARQAIVAAKAELSRLESAILAGDATVDGAALAAAEAEVRRGEVFLAGIVSRRAQTVEAERLAAIPVLEAEIVATYGDHAGDVADLYDTALEAMTALASAVRRGNDAIPDLAHRLIALAPLPNDLNPNRDGGQIIVGPVAVTEIDASGLVAALAVQAVRGAGIVPGSQYHGYLTRAATEGVIDTIRSREVAIAEWRR